MPYDAIIVGARCGGAPTAMLLARRGYRVLLADKDRFPSDMKLSTHLVWQSGATCLRRWGLLDAMAATGCPPIRGCRIDLGPVILCGAPPAAGDVADAYSPRRLVLDKILVNAAVAAGVEFRERFKVTEVLRDGSKVLGIQGTINGATVEEHATIVVGADGRNSQIARCVGAAVYNRKPRLQGTYFAYWRNAPGDDRLWGPRLWHGTHRTWHLF